MVNHMSYSSGVALILLALVQASVFAAATSEQSTPSSELPTHAIEQAMRATAESLDGENTRQGIESCTDIKRRFQDIHETENLRAFKKEHSQAVQNIKSCVTALFARLGEPQTVVVDDLLRIVLFIDEATDSRGSVRCVTMIFVENDKKGMSRGCSVVPRKEFWDPGSPLWAREADCGRMVPICAREPQSEETRYTIGRVSIDADVRRPQGSIASGAAQESNGIQYATLVYDTNKGFTLSITVVDNLVQISDG